MWLQPPLFSIATVHFGHCRREGEREGGKGRGGRGKEGGREEGRGKGGRGKGGREGRRDKSEMRKEESSIHL